MEINVDLIKILLASQSFIKFDIFRFEKVMQLESHVETRMQTKFYLTMKPLLMPFIQKFLGNDTTEEIIMTVAGILDTSCFEILLMSEQLLTVQHLFAKRAPSVK
jgi:hypothetical protein